ncbi:MULTISPECIES: YlaH-like family protein [Bacillaceae]|uniref:YlaH-like family protein n=1 Tax=Evansella alkalicola TaxID=745819 RepID=A0ABS6JPK4_9BACI|nr:MULTISPECIES: YlaH-like family protein [Bacillaceae]MBU9720493.1 YlaH-like family protein [Bacillus alkalicola]
MLFFLAAVADAPTYNMTPIAEMLGLTNPENFFFGFPIMYLIVTVLTVIVFNLGFARKLPVLKQAIVYILMLLGNILLTLLALILPIIESLFVATLVLGVYKLQMKRHKTDTGEAVEE